MKKRKDKQITVVSSGIGNSEFGIFDPSSIMNEFDVQKTAESENLYPAIAQGYPVNGIKDADKKDRFK